MSRTLSTTHSDAIAAGPVGAPIILVQFDGVYWTNHNENVDYDDGDGNQTYLGGTKAIKVTSVVQDSSTSGGRATIEVPIYDEATRQFIRGPNFMRSAAKVFKSVAYETLATADAEEMLEGIVFNRVIANGVAKIEIRSARSIRTYPNNAIIEQEGWPYVGTEGTYAIGGRVFTDTLG